MVNVAVLLCAPVKFCGKLVTVMEAPSNPCT